MAVLLCPLATARGEIGDKNLSLSRKGNIHPFRTQEDIRRLYRCGIRNIGCYLTAFRKTNHFAISVSLYKQEVARHLTDWYSSSWAPLPSGWSNFLPLFFLTNAPTPHATRDSECSMSTQTPSYFLLLLTLSGRVSYPQQLTSDMNLSPLANASSPCSGHLRSGHLCSGRLFCAVCCVLCSTTYCQNCC